MKFINSYVFINILLIIIITIEKINSSELNGVDEKVKISNLLRNEPVGLIRYIKNDRKISELRYDDKMSSSSSSSSDDENVGKIFTLNLNKYKRQRYGKICPPGKKYDGGMRCRQVWN